MLAGGQGLLLSFALMASSIRKHSANAFLGILLAVCSVELLNAWSMSIHYHCQPHAFPFWLFGSYLLLPSSLWVFVLYQTKSNFIFRKHHALLFVPALVEIVTEFLVFYFPENPLVTFAFLKSPVWFVFTEVLPVVWMVGVLIRYAMLLRKEDRQVTQPQAYKQYGFLLVFSILAILWIAEALFYLPVYTFTELLLCLFLYVMGYIVYFQPGFFETPSVAQSHPSEDAFQLYDDAESLLRLQTLLKQEKLYLQPRLKVADVADRLNLPSRYLSYLINKTCQTNFTTFINRYRIEEVLERLQNPQEQHKTIVGIALDSGFNSKSAFNQVFKTVTGQTPSEFLSATKPLEHQK